MSITYQYLYPWGKSFSLTVNQKELGSITSNTLTAQQKHKGNHDNQRKTKEPIKESKGKTQLNKLISLWTIKNRENPSSNHKT